MANSHQFLSRKLHSLLGVIPIGIFVLFHLVINHQSTKGPEAFNSAAAIPESLPFLIVVEFVVIYIPIFFHAVYGIYIAFQAKNNLGNYGYFRNQMFFLQRITGIITLIFIAWHVYQTRIQLALGNVELNYDMMHNILSNPAMFIFYLVGTLCAVFHLSNGLWSFLVHWGITVGPRSQRIATYATMIFFVVVSIIGIRALTGFIS